MNIRYPQMGLLALGFWAGTLQAASDFPLDVAGIKLGMTEAQVRAALQAFDPDLKITTTQGFFNYSDGVDHTLKTPEFLDKLEATPTVAYRTGFTIYFASPPAAPTVLALRRSTASDTPPTKAQLEESLQQKYGAPVILAQTGYWVWEQQGQPSCIRTLNYKKQLEPNVSGLAYETVIQQLQMRQQDKRNQLPADLATCGAYLQLSRSNHDPVSQFELSMLDLGEIWQTEVATQAWVEQLTQEAVKKRVGQGKVPKL